MSRPYMGLERVIWDSNTETSGNIIPVDTVKEDYMKLHEIAKQTS